MLAHYVQHKVSPRTLTNITRLARTMASHAYYMYRMQRENRHLLGNPSARGHARETDASSPVQAAGGDVNSSHVLVP